MQPYLKLCEAFPPLVLYLSSVTFMLHAFICKIDLVRENLCSYVCSQSFTANKRAELEGQPH